MPVSVVVARPAQRLARRAADWADGGERLPHLLGTTIPLEPPSRFDSAAAGHQFFDVGGNGRAQLCSARDKSWNRVGGECGRIAEIEFSGTCAPVDVLVDDPGLEIPERGDGEYAEGDLGNTSGEIDGNEAATDFDGQSNEGKGHHNHVR